MVVPVGYTDGYANPIAGTRSAMQNRLQHNVLFISSPMKENSVFICSLTLLKASRRRQSPSLAAPFLAILILTSKHCQAIFQGCFLGPCPAAPRIRPTYFVFRTNER